MTDDTTAVLGEISVDESPYPIVKCFRHERHEAHEWGQYPPGDKYTKNCPGID